MKTECDEIHTIDDLPRTFESLQSFCWNLLLTHKHLAEKYQKLLHREFGRSSEKQISSDIVQLAMEGLLSQIAATQQKQKEDPQESFVTVPSHSRRKKHPGRNALPEDIEKEVVVHDVSEQEKQCGICNKQMDEIARKKHITVERIPAQYKVCQHEYPIYGCSCCKDTIVKAEPLVLPIAKGIAEVGLLCFVLVSKYLYHLPLYRIQRQIYHESRIWFSRQTMVGWVGKLAGLLQRLYDELLLQYAQSRIKHCDDTPIPVQRAGEKGKIRNGYLWGGIGVSSEPVVVFMYDNHRSGEAAKRLLKGSSSRDYLMCDDCSSFNGAIKDFKLLALLCMAHSRRQFADAVVCGWKADFGKWVIRKIGQLYKVERFADRKKVNGEVRLQIRQRLSKSVLDKLKKRLLDPGFAKIPGSTMSNAINYMLSKWERVERYLESGELPIDNNILERMFRDVVIGRNAWIKAGSEQGAKWMAIIYTIFATCKLNGVNVHEYLPDVLQRLVIRPKEQSVKDLLPAEWKKTQHGNKAVLASIQYPKN